MDIIIALMGGIPESPYDRIDIMINGAQLTARPIEFEYDEKGMPSKAIRYETVDPVTSQMVQFSLSDIDISGNLVSQAATAVRSSCGGAKLQSANRSIKPQFIDPIEAGFFRIDTL